jgi:hypothetical protein
MRITEKKLGVRSKETEYWYAAHAGVGTMSAAGVKETG